MGRPKGSKNKSTVSKEPKKRFSLSDESLSDELDSVTDVESSITEDVSVTENNNFEPLCNEEENIPPTLKKKGKAVKTYPVCPRCGKETYLDLIRLDTNLITGMASTHRDHPRFVKVCRACCEALSDVLDKWLGTYPTKWENRSEGF